MSVEVAGVDPGLDEIVELVESHETETHADGVESEFRFAQSAEFEEGAAETRWEALAHQC